jgi:hypothetical protein
VRKKFRKWMKPNADYTSFKCEKAGGAAQILKNGKQRGKD